MSTQVQALNRAVGLLDRSLAMNKGRQLVSSRYLIDLVLDVRNELVETARVLAIDIEPDEPGPKRVPAMTPTDPPPPPKAVAVSPPRSNA